MNSDVALIKDFVNTYNVETSEDVIEQWLGDRGLATGRLTGGDVQRAQIVREALRALLLANNGGPDPSAALKILADAGRRAPLQVGFDQAGVAQLEPAAKGIDAAIGQLLAAVQRIQAGGDWHRFKACAAGDCHWAYFDESRNRSRHWCSMEVCGNRAKARSYRARGGGA